MNEVKQAVFEDLESGLLEVCKNIVSAPISPLLVLIAGGSCAGTTYFAKQLQAAINMALVPLDNYFKSFFENTIPRDDQGRPLFDLPESFRLDEFQEDLFKLLQGQDINLPEYDLAENTRVSRGGGLVSATDIIAAEGLFTILAAQEVFQIPLKIFIDADYNIRLARRIKRDFNRFGIPRDVITKHFEEAVEPYHIEYVLPQREEADIVIINNFA